MRKRNEGTNCYLPFDFILEEQKIIIELDGNQHFVQVNNWANPEETLKRDKYKMKKANDNGYSVICVRKMNIKFFKNNVMFSFNLISFFFFLNFLV